MKQITLLFIAVTLNSFGCDMCVSYFGFNPNFYQNRIGFNYSYLSGSGAHSHGNHNHSNAHSHHNDELEVFTRYELDGLFFRENGDQIIVRLPFVDNYQIYNGYIGNRKSGIGDPLALYLKEFQFARDTNNTYRLYIGGGLRLPLGNFDSNFVDPNLEQGSRSLGISLTSTMLIKKQYLGYALNAIYMYNLTNEHNFQFGQQINLNTDIYVYLNKYYIPFVGMFHEFMRSNYLEEVNQMNSGGILSYANFGQQLFYKNMAIKYVFQMPIYQHLNGSQANSSGRHLISLNYFLK